MELLKLCIGQICSIRAKILCLECLDKHKSKDYIEEAQSDVLLNSSIREDVISEI